MAIETEVKLRLADGSAAARALLEGLGYRARGPRALQVDQLFDRPDGELKAGGRALRLRSSCGRWVLTYKGPPDGGPHKSREEIELQVEDGEAMELVLLALGYCAEFRYEKYRAVFAREGEPGVVLLDETPMGDFLELEGPAEWIERTTARLGFYPGDYVLSTYPALYDRYQKMHPNMPCNMMVFKPDSTP